jgi:AraC family transcriptional regulator of adaptative response / DNA-3-methyladenine glycosylase II
VTLKLSYRSPYDWDAMLAFLTLRAIPGVETVRDGVYARTIAIGEHRGMISVGPSTGDKLSVTVRFPDLTALPAIIARVRRVFDLAADPVTIGAHLSQDPGLAPLVAARPGLRCPGAWDGFELAVRAVLGQQITVSAAIILAGKLTGDYGEPLAEAYPGFEALTHVFPNAEQLAAADLSGLPMPRARSSALSALAHAVAADPTLVAPRGSLEEAIATLRGLAGIGEWTAQYIAMRQLREPDAFPAADIGLMRAMADAEGTRPNAAALLAHAERWRPWRAYAAQHLWASEAYPVKSSKPAAKTPKEKSDADRQAA